MKEKFKIKKAVWLDPWHVEEQESLLEDMALQGWQLKKVNYRSFIFEKSSPAETTYRIGFIKKDEKFDEKIAEYEQAGWEFVASSGNLRIFRGYGLDIERKNQAEEWKLLRKSLLIEKIPVILFTFLTVAFLVYRIYQWPAETFLADIILAALIINLLVAGSLLIRLIGAYSSVSNLIKRLEAGQSLHRGKDYKKRISRNRAISVGGAIIMLPVFIIVFGNLVVSHPTSPSEVPEGEELPVVQLADIIEEDLQPYINKGETENYYREEWGITVPKQYSLRESVTDPDHNWESGNSDTSHLWSYRYTSRTEWLSGRLAQSMEEQYSRQSPLEDYETMESTDFDALWVSENHLMTAVIARAGRDVFYVQYSGEKPVEILVESIAEKLRK